MKRGFFLFLLLMFAGTGALVAQVPIITAQPTNQKVLLHNPATFSVTVSNINGPFTYQWLFNGSNLPSGIITTVAGGLFAGPATNANVNAPRGVAVDINGNTFVADSGNNCIRKVDTNGNLTTVAGIGVAGYAGEGGPAVNATLNTPLGVTADRKGNIFFVDGRNERVRKVDTNGIITTVAGNGSLGYSGDGGPATNASITTASGRASNPEGLAVDSQGNLFIADFGNARVRKVDTNGITTTVAGNGTNGYSGDGGAATNARLNSLLDVAVDTNGNLFIADTGNNRIRKVNTGGIITTVAGNGTNAYYGDNGPATNASLQAPNGVALDGLGNLFISDFGDSRVREVLAGGIIVTVAGNGNNSYSGDGGAATNASLTYPFGVAVDGQHNLLIADFGENRVRKVSPLGIISTLAGNGTPGYAGNGVPATGASLNAPDSVAVDTNGNLIIADTGNNRVREVDSSGTIITVAGNGTNAYSGDDGPATNASLSTPISVVEDNQGNLFISDSSNARIRKVDTNGIITTVAGNGTNAYLGDNGPATNASLFSPFAVAVDSHTNLFIADYFNNRIRKVNPSGIITTVAGNGMESFSGDNGPATNAGLLFPEGLAVDGQGNLFVGEPANVVDRVRKVNTSGIITTVAGNGTNGYSGDGGVATNAALNQPEGLCVDGQGNFYIADTANFRVRKVDTNKIIITSAGDGTDSYGGDGGPPTNASLAAPYGVAVDTHGDMFIADAGDNRIREVIPPNGPTLTLNNVTTNNAGDYQVIITDSHGSTTSSVATLTIVAPGSFLFTGVNTANFNFTWSATVGQAYQIQYSPNLSLAVWTNLSDRIVATNSTMETSDSIGTNDLRFYRIEQVPLR